MEQVYFTIVYLNVMQIWRGDLDLISHVAVKCSQVNKVVCLLHKVHLVSLPNSDGYRGLLCDQHEHFRREEKQFKNCGETQFLLFVST